MIEFKEMKFKIENKEMSSKFQLRLFDLGYFWPMGNEVQNYPIVHLYTTDKGLIEWDGDNYKGYPDDSFPERKFSTFEDIKAKDMNEELRCIICKELAGYCICDEVVEEEYNMTLGQAIDLMSQGKKIECDNKERKHEYLIFHMDDFCWKNKGDDSFEGAQLGVNSGFSDCKFKEYKPAPKPPKMISWVRPKVVWYQDEDGPKISTCKWFKQHKNDFDMVCKVVEWETIQAPETYEGVTDEN